MKFSAALSTKRAWAEAVDDLVRQAHADFGDKPADLALLFVHPGYVGRLGEDVRGMQEALGARHLIGCTGGGIIGAQREVEKRPAASLLVAQLPGVDVLPFHITDPEVEEATGPEYWHFQMGLQPQAQPNFILLVDPYTMQPATRLVQELSEAYPGAPLIGGLASGAHKPGENRLFLDGEIYDEGAVGVALSGPVVLRSIVSQGCKPIGEPLVITRAEKNIIFEVAGQPPMQVLQELLPKLPARDQRLARHALFIGRVINEYQEEFGRGDFLIRNLIGTDPKSGALAIGDWIRTGQTVQFQIRDGQTAHEDLKAMLEKQRGASPAEPPRGVVLFSCLGRGENMYGAPDHDISAIHEHLGAVPTAGFFCNGEIGPVGERAFVHGFTSVIGLFGERPVEK